MDTTSARYHLRSFIPKLHITNVMEYTLLFSCWHAVWPASYHVANGPAPGRKSLSLSLLLFQCTCLPCCKSRVTRQGCSRHGYYTSVLRYSYNIRCKPNCSRFLILAGIITVFCIRIRSITRCVFQSTTLFADPSSYCLHPSKYSSMSSSLLYLVNIDEWPFTDVQYLLFYFFIQYNVGNHSLPLYSSDHCPCTRTQRVIFKQSISVRTTQHGIQNVQLRIATFLTGRCALMPIILFDVVANI